MLCRNYYAVVEGLVTGPKEKALVGLLTCLRKVIRVRTCHDSWPVDIRVFFFLFCLAEIFLVGQSCQFVQVLVEMISSPIHLQEETALFGTGGSTWSWKNWSHLVRPCSNQYLKVLTIVDPFFWFGNGDVFFQITWGGGSRWAACSKPSRCRIIYFGMEFSWPLVWSKME